MKAFAKLFEDLDQTTSTNEKLHIMAKFFRERDPETCAWTLYFLAGRRPKKLIGAGKLRTWVKEETGTPDWLMEECYSAVGDTAEMVALIFSGQSTTDLTAPGETGVITGQATYADDDLNEISLGDWMNLRLLPLANENETEQRRQVISWWKQLKTNEIFILNKFLTGGLRVGVSETLVYRALENVLELPRSVIATRLLGNWVPSAEFYLRVARPGSNNAVVDSPGDAQNPFGSGSKTQALPKPFCLAAPLEGDVNELGAIEDWQIEWKWDGIRCQVVKVGSHVEIWSRGEERITESFPELALSLARIQGSWIFDGELVAGDWRHPSLFQELQKRLNRKKPSAKMQKENPVAFLAYDLLQENETAWSDRPLAERRTRLEQLTRPYLDRDLGISPLLQPKNWLDAAVLRDHSRGIAAEGLMLKKRSAPYETGRKRGIWVKWKVAPLTIDAILTSAQPGTGRRASLYTDYTFSIWQGEALVPVAKAYSGLSDKEIHDLDQWIRKHTISRFGPVRALEPVRVFEIGFEGLAKSTRHKSGYAVRFPRILRERVDKKPADADTVSNMDALLRALQDGPAEELPDDQLSFALSPFANDPDAGPR